MMSEKPFFEFDILGFTDRDAETLEAFSKSKFDPATVRTRAEDIIYTGKLTAYVNELLRNPSDAFTRFILGEIEITTGKLTAKRVEKFVPIVKKAIQSTLLDMATRSIKFGSDEATAPAPPPPPPLPAPSPPASAPAAGAHDPPRAIVTTAEELEAFDIVRRLCADSALAEKHPVSYKDAVNYFGVNIGGPKKWFLRLFLDGKRKALVSKVAPDRAAMLAPGFEVEAAPDVLGKSRVYINGNRDLDRLRPLILLAYEDEVRRSEAGAAEEEDAGEGAAVTH
jgi:hypothetical protein